MCDYSLEAYKTRKAIAGEDLVLRQFPSHSKGFVAAEDADTPHTYSWTGIPKDGPCAVCCEPGMTMTLHLPTGDLDVTFAQLPKLEHGPFHRDGVENDKGEFANLQSFDSGLRATVIKPLPDSLRKAVEAPEEIEDVEHQRAHEAGVVAVYEALGV